MQQTKSYCSSCTIRRKQGIRITHSSKTIEDLKNASTIMMHVSILPFSPYTVLRHINDISSLIVCINSLTLMLCDAKRTASIDEMGRQLSIHLLVLGAISDTPALWRHLALMTSPRRFVVGLPLSITDSRKKQLRILTDTAMCINRRCAWCHGLRVWNDYDRDWSAALSLGYCCCCCCCCLSAVVTVSVGRRPVFR